MGNEAVARREHGEAARIVAVLQEGVPESLRARFLLRPEIQAIRR
jgi:hypothetical protein